MQLIIKLTNGCNLRCVYCSEGDPKKVSFLAKELLFKLVDDAEELLTKTNDNTLELLWHGGEPMTYPKKDLCEVMDYAQARLSPKYKVHFFMQSNGTLLDEEWLDIIKKYDIGLGISLDGYQELHDKNRIDAQGGPTFNKICSNIELLRLHNINVGTLMVLNTAENIDVKKLYNILKNNDFSCKIHPVVPCGRAAERKDCAKIYDRYVELMQGLYRLSMEEDVPVIIEPMANILESILGKNIITECSFAGNCGEKFICVYVDGSVSFCGRHDEEFSLKFGNLQQDSLWNLYCSSNAERIRNRQKYLQEHDCKNCTDYDLCHGGCAFEAANSFGYVEHKFLHCSGRKKLLNFLRTEGLVLLKKYLLREHRFVRHAIQENKAILEELQKNATE